MNNNETPIQTNEQAGATHLPNRTSRMKSHRRMHPVLKSILIIGIILIVAGGAYAGYLYIKFDNMLGKISSDDPMAVDEEKSSPQQPKVILLLGLDTREETRSLNTDVIMVAALNPNTKSVSLLSLPRDTYMKPDGYKARKANAFYSIAMRQDKQPPEKLVKELFGNFLDIPIDYVTVINFKTFEDIIDELGGIEVNVDMDMCYIDDADGTNIQLKQGVQKLKGKEALDFVRYRHSSRKCDVRTAESNDYERNERQQLVLSAMVDKLTSIGGLMKLGNVFDVVGNHMETDIPKAQLKSFIKAFATVKNENIEYITLEGQWKSPYIQLKEADLNNAKQKLKAGLLTDPGADAGTP